MKPHGTFSLTAEGLARILSISDSPYLGINYDCANIHRAGYVETRDGAANWRALASGGAEAEVLKTVVHRVVHFHAKDLTADGVCTALGTGTVDVAGCIQVLKDAGYTGAVSLETEGGMPFAESVELAEISSRYLDGILG